ncbi:hypothetical protein GCM10027423_19630 [Spirosoma arcticum]
MKAKKSKSQRRSVKASTPSMTSPKSAFPYKPNFQVLKVNKTAALPKSKSHIRVMRGQFT